MSAGLVPFIRRRYAWLAAATLALAAFNLTFRLGHEFVAEWDESLYAISAWETLTNGSWIGTTFLGQLDYYNTKPPLMMWLIAGAFKLLGPSLWSLRAVSVLSAWLTVFVLQRWTRRRFGDAEALLAAVVLSTMFGFLYVHSGRSAATDAPFTLVMLLVVIVLCEGEERPQRYGWLGLLLAAAFLLRGMAVLMPTAMIALAWIWRPREMAMRWRPLAGAAILFAIPVVAWGVARQRLDGWQFISRLFMYDFVARSVSSIEEHPGGPLYYLNILQKHHYDWLIAGIAAVTLYPRSRIWPYAGNPVFLRRALLAWAVVTIGIPTLMQTKLPWYLNSFYPLFALGIGVTIARALSMESDSRGLWRRRAALAAVCVLMFGVAETKLLWYSFDKRDLRHSEQGLILAERERLRGRRLYYERGTRGGYFVAAALAGGYPEMIADRAEFLERGGDSDFLLTSNQCDEPELVLVSSNGTSSLCRRAHLQSSVLAP